MLWPPHAKKWLIGKDSDAGKGWRKEKGTTEDEMIGWRHWLNGYEFEQTPGVGGGQGSLACCSPQGRKESDVTELLNNNKTRSGEDMAQNEVRDWFLVDVAPTKSKAGFSSQCEAKSLQYSFRRGMWSDGHEMIWGLHGELWGWGLEWKQGDQFNN